VRPDTQRARTRIFGRYLRSFLLFKPHGFAALRFRKRALARAAIPADTQVVMTLTVLQGARAVAALAVLQMHAIQATEKRGGASGPRWLTYILEHGYLGVDFFFVLSGFIILHAHGRDPQGVEAAVSYLRKRLTRIYVPYLPIAGAVVALYIVFPEAASNKNWSFITSLTLVPAEFPPSPALSVAWTLVHEMVFYLIFLASYFVRCFRCLITVWVALIASAAYYKAAIPYDALEPFVGGVVQTILAPINLEFVAGMLSAWAVRSLPNSWSGPFLAAGLLGLVLFLSPLGEGASRVWFGVAMAFVVAGLVWRELEGKIATPLWLVFLGNASYAIYLVHASAISIGWRLAERFGLSLTWPAGAILSCALGLICGVLYHVLYERPALKSANSWRRSGQPPTMPPRTI
jgi:peptidoglycan/LPS O-acetylase OafA/YrhL